MCCEVPLAAAEPATAGAAGGPEATRALHPAHADGGGGRALPWWRCRCAAGSAAAVKSAVEPAACSATSFPAPLNATMCYGLEDKPVNKMGAPINSLASCLAACCDDPSCTLYQYADPESGSKHGSGW